MPYFEPQTDELSDGMLEMSRMFGEAKAAEILRGYEEMAANDEQEAEAFEWIEAHVGECL